MIILSLFNAKKAFEHSNNAQKPFFENHIFGVMIVLICERDKQNTALLRQLRAT